MVNLTQNSSQPQLISRPLSSGGKVIDIFIAWADMSTITLDMGSQGTSLGMRTIMSVYVDNYAGGTPVTIQVDGFATKLTIQPGQQGSYPIFMTGLSRINITPASGGGYTSFTFCDFALSQNSWNAASLSQATSDINLAQVTAGPSNGRYLAMRDVVLDGLISAAGTPSGNALTVQDATFGLVMSAVTTPATQRVLYVSDSALYTEIANVINPTNNAYFAVQDAVLAAIVTKDEDGTATHINVVDTALAAIITGDQATGAKALMVVDTLVESRLATMVTSLATIAAGAGQFPTTNGKGTIPTGNILSPFGTLVPPHGWKIHNPDANEDLWVTDDGSAPAPNNGYRVAANGGEYSTTNGETISNAVQVYGATAGHIVLGRAW